MATTMLPAFQTKHSTTLACPIASCVFSLSQQSDNGLSNGTTLWLGTDPASTVPAAANKPQGGQCLSAYLAHSAVVKPGMRAIDLGSGIGLTALTLARLGCHTIASDLPFVISSCLAKNIENNIPQLLPGSEILVRELDWTVPPEHWFWQHETIIASPTCSPSEPQHPTHGFDLIVSSDTIYSLELVTPFLRTIHSLCKASVSASRSPVVFICVERRDPAVIDRTLEDAKSIWGFTVNRVPQHKISKALGKSGLKWNKDDWEGVELWKLTLRG